MTKDNRSITPKEFILVWGIILAGVMVFWSIIFAISLPAVRRLIETIT